MSVAEPTVAEPNVAPAPRTKRRPLAKRAMHAVRRAHLYFGLFLLPWAVLYGATGFLFNHPTAFSDQPTTSFGASELRGTPMEALPKPVAVAELVVADLNERAQGARTYTLVEPEKAKYTRDFAFATVKADGQEVSVLFDVTSTGGTVRTKTAPPPAKEVEKAPFALAGTKSAEVKGGGEKGAAPKGAGRGEKGGGEKGGGRGERAAPKGETPGHVHTAGNAPRPKPLIDVGTAVVTGVIGYASGVQLPDPLHERVRAAIPVVLERTGFPEGEITATTVPDLSFRISDGEKVWTVSYNSQTGAVSGLTADSAPPAEELSTRRFLTRLHREHGFPGSPNAKWFWCVIVDVMAFVMVFWGVSGVFMWWQLKATRKLGLLVLLLSVCAAVALGFGMHDVLAPRQ